MNVMVSGITTASVVLWGLTVVAVIGAAVVVLTRDVMRLVLGLGAFLLAIAGFYVYFGLAFLAAAQLFVYVGGVLVLVLFALMLLRRDAAGGVELGRRFDIAALSVALGLFVLLAVTLSDLVPTRPLAAAGPGVAALGATLLGGDIAAFELLGVLLLAAIVAVVAIVGGGERG